MTFFIGRGFAELQILKKWKWPYLLNWVEYYDENLHTHWYWHDVAHEIVILHLGLVKVLPRFKFWKQWKEIAKWYFLSVEALPSSKFWKSENGPISWTEWNIMMKICIHIDIDMM